MTENLHHVASNPDRGVIRPADRPLTANASVLAPRGAIVNTAIRVACDGLVQSSGSEIEECRAGRHPRKPAFGSGYLWKFSRQVGAARGAAHPGGSAEKTCYADI